MISDFQRWHCRLAKLWRPAALVFCLVLAGCANWSGHRPPRYDGPGMLPPLAYYQLLSKMSPAELGRERAVLAALPTTPNTHLRMAMLYGHPRGPQEIGKAIGLLDGLLKSNDPAAVGLQPLARLLADNYLERQNERLRLEGQLERQGLQLKESQRKAAELQEKLDGLADIELTLPRRGTRTTRPNTGGRPR